MTVTIYYQADPVTPAVILHAEFVRMVALDSIEVKCWGNGSVIHRKIQNFKVDYTPFAV